MFYRCRHTGFVAAGIQIARLICKYLVPTSASLLVDSALTLTVLDDTISFSANFAQPRSYKVWRLDFVEKEDQIQGIRR